MDWQGNKLGNYQVECLLGSGAFADVYLGKHVYLNTSAAIKILQTRLGENDLQSFLEEARAVANLIHPSIIRVLEFGVEGQIPYLIMDYAPAGTLRQLHPRPTRLTVGECVTYMNQITAALQHAHDHRVIHRDVKPENILIGPHEQLLLSDFGIAVAAQSSRYQAQQEFGGTAAYSSPEQIQGKASYASDQYALGIMLYEWLTGELPFRGSFYEVCSQHLFKPAPSLLDKVSSLPPTVEQVYQRAVAKDSQQRFARVDDFAQALEMAHRGDDPTVLLKSGFSASADSSTPPSPSVSAGISVTLPATEAAPSPSLPPYGRRQEQRYTSSLQPRIPSVPPAIRWEKPHPVPSVLIAILLVLLLITGIWGYSRQGGGSNQPASQGQSPQPTQTTSDSSNGSNVVDSTLTPVPTPTPTPQPSGVVSDGTIKINKMLACGNCNDPVHVKVDTVTVQNGNGRMIWTLTLTNVSGATIHVYGPTISLHDSTSAQDSSPASISDSDSGFCDPYLDSNLDCSAIFTFLPYTQTTYTLNVEITGYNFDIKFDPLEVTFS